MADPQRRPTLARGTIQHTQFAAIIGLLSTTEVYEFVSKPFNVKKPILLGRSKRQAYEEQPFNFAVLVPQRDGKWSVRSQQEVNNIKDTDQALQQVWPDLQTLISESETAHQERQAAQRQRHDELQDDMILQAFRQAKTRHYKKQEDRLRAHFSTTLRSRFLEGTIRATVAGFAVSLFNSAREYKSGLKSGLQAVSKVVIDTLASCALGAVTTIAAVYLELRFGFQRNAAVYIFTFLEGVLLVRKFLQSQISLKEFVGCTVQLITCKFIEMGVTMAVGAVAHAINKSGLQTFSTKWWSLQLVTIAVGAIAATKACEGVANAIAKVSLTVNANGNANANANANANVVNLAFYYGVG